MNHRCLPPLVCLLFFACSGSPPGGEEQDAGPGDDPPDRGEITLDVSAPSPGAELLASEHPAISVTGTATTSNEGRTLDVWVGAERAEVDANGAFSAEVTPEVGINHIVVEGRDGLARPVEERMDVMWAPEYLAPDEGTTRFDLADGLKLRLAQRFFDSRLFGTDLDLSDDPIVATDLAQIVELILWFVDLAELVEEGISFGEGGASLEVELTEIERGNVVVDAEIIDDPVTGLDLFIDLDDVFLGMDGAFSFDDSEWTIEGGLMADLRAFAGVTIESEPGGELTADITEITASLGPLEPMFEGEDGDELNAFIEVGEKSFRDIVSEVIAEELIPTFTDGLPELFETLLSTMDELLNDLSFELDPGLGEPVTLSLGGEVGGLDVVAGPPLSSEPGHVTLRQNLTVETSGEPHHPESRGAPRVDTAPEAPQSPGAGAQLAARQDLLNSLLHALWNAGLLDGEISVGDITAEVSAALPPVVTAAPSATSCRIDGARCDVILQLGQVAVEAFDSSYALSASAGARLALSGGEVSLAIQEVPDVRVWQTSEEAAHLPAEAVHALVTDVIWPDLLSAIGDELSIPLPLPDLDELGLPLAASGLEGAALRLVMRDRLSVESGFVGLSADLELEVP